MRPRRAAGGCDPGAGEPPHVAGSGLAGRAEALCLLGKHGSGRGAQRGRTRQRGSPEAAIDVSAAHPPRLLLRNAGPRKRVPPGPPGMAAAPKMAPRVGAAPCRGLCRHLPAGAVRVARPSSPLALRAPLARAPTRRFTRLGLIRECSARRGSPPCPRGSRCCLLHPVLSRAGSRPGPALHTPGLCLRTSKAGEPPGPASCRPRSGCSLPSVPWCLPTLPGPCCWLPHLQSLQANSPTR